MSTRVSITPGCFQKSRKVGVSLSTDQVQLKFCMLLELLPHASKHQLFLHMYICVHMHTHSSKISESLLVVERKTERERERGRHWARVKVFPIHLCQSICSFRSGLSMHRRKGKEATGDYKRV